MIARAYTRHLTPRREDRGWRIPNIIDGQIVEEIGALMHYSRDIDIYIPPRVYNSKITATWRICKFARVCQNLF